MTLYLKIYSGLKSLALNIQGHQFTTDQKSAKAGQNARGGCKAPGYHFDKIFLNLFFDLKK